MHLAFLHFQVSAPRRWYSRSFARIITLFFVSNETGDTAFVPVFESGDRELLSQPGCHRKMAAAFLSTKSVRKDSNSQMLFC